jgi:SAM-dependent methyltransferase
MNAARIPPWRDSARRARWSLPSYDWISAVGQPSREQPRRSLVAGCGTGAEAFALRRRFRRAEIVGVDFAERAIAAAQQLQKRSSGTRDIRFVHGDLTSSNFMGAIGGGFDFISCHGVLSYLPAVDRALRNLRRCLTPEGVLYAGVNGAAHFSESWRKFLPAFGFDTASWPGGEKLWRHLELTAALAGDERGEILQRGVHYLQSDLFGPLIRNHPLGEWVRKFRAAGLEFRGSYVMPRLLRPAINDGSSALFLPRSRAEVAELLDLLRPAAFHALIFTRQEEAVPPWGNGRELVRWRPIRTPLLRRASLERARVVKLEHRAANLLIELRRASWELEVLRASDGERSLREILGATNLAVAPAALRRQLYLFYLLELINLRPPLQK